MQSSITKKKKPNSFVLQQSSILTNLQKDLLQSRIAVDHIVKSRKQEELQGRNLEHIQNQIHTCVTNFNAQMKRQNILKELIDVVKGQMTKIKNRQKQYKEAEQKGLDKSLKVFRDDIDKIEHRKNQQIAKIGELKELCDQSRTQRVVYSKLFKKIEKDIKHQVDKYKMEIVNTQKSRIQIKINEKMAQKERENRTQSTVNIDDNQSDKSLEIHTILDFCYNRQRQIHLNRASSIMKNLNNTQIESHKQLPYIEQMLNMLIKNDNPKQHSQYSLLCIQEINKFNNRIYALCQCQSISDIKKRLWNIGELNEDIMNEINRINEDIQLKQTQIKEFNQFVHNQKDLDNQVFDPELSEVYLPKKISLTNGEKQNLTSQQQNKKFAKNKISKGKQMTLDFSSEFQAENFEQIFIDVCALFTIKSNEFKDSNGSSEKIEEKNKHQLLTEMNFLQIEQKYKQMDLIIESLCENNNNRRPVRKNLNRHSSINCSTINNLRSQASFDKKDKFDELTNIFNRMEKFGFCQKFLDQQGFEGEYRKQIGKKNRTRIIKKI